MRAFLALLLAVSPCQAAIQRSAPVVRAAHHGKSLDLPRLQTRLPLSHAVLPEATRAELGAQAVLGNMAEAMKGATSEKASAEQGAEVSNAQFDLQAAPKGSGVEVPGVESAGGPNLGPSGPQAPEQKKKGFIARRFQVFNDPERNNAFWRFFTGEQIYLLGIQMYIVALPYLMSAFTRNTLKNPSMPAEEITALIRENRSNSRIAHWVSQALSYMATPLFTRGGEAPPKPWLVRSAYIRAGVIFGVPLLFFSTGLMSGGTALFVLMALIGVQSFFQGLYATTSAGSAARIVGDPSVTADERVRANSIRSFGSAVVAVIAPAIAARIASIPDWFGKSGTGSAVIYGLYAFTTAMAGFIFSGIKLIDQDKKSGALPARVGFWESVKSVFSSMKEGLGIIFQNRFLRTLLMLNLISALFTDPLTFNVLPEYVETVMKSSAGALDGVLGIPGLGWLLSGLVSTPMGFFGLLVAFSSIGSALAAIFVNPLRRFFQRFGWKTEEQLTVPFYMIAALEAAAFWAMIWFPSFWLVLGLYGLQALSSGGATLIITGIYQKRLGAEGQRKMTQILAASSFMQIIAAIIATFVYGYLLKGLPISTSLLIAAGAMTVLGLLRLASPWLFFSKDERKGTDKPAEKRPNLHPENRTGGENLPGANGPLSVGL